MCSARTLYSYTETPGDNFCALVYRLIIPSRALSEDLLMADSKSFTAITKAYQHEDGDLSFFVKGIRI